MANKSTLTREIRRAAGVSYRTAALCVDAMFDALCSGLSGGERFELRGFGSFEFRTLPERECRTLISGGKVIPAHRRVVFRPCESLRRAVWGKK